MFMIFIILIVLIVTVYILNNVCDLLLSINYLLFWLKSYSLLKYDFIRFYNDKMLKPLQHMWV
jgi:hypothetical protein